MKKTIFFILFLTAYLMCARAETIVLRTGARVRGEILLQNEEVVIIRDASGARFQYPRAEVVEIIAAEEAEQEVQTEKHVEVSTQKKATVLVEAAAGVAVLPKDTIGAVMSIDMLVGSHKIGDKHLFLGAGVGYHGFYLADEKYNFMPIEVALRMPLIEQKHAPMFGMALGYGIALSKDYVGGIYAGVDLGYRYTINTKTALVAALYAQFQQARLLTNETIEGNMFSHITGRNLVAAGLKIAIYL
jgi:hypothetical protein